MSQRYALQALVEASGMSEAGLARRVGLSGTKLKEARAHGLPEDAADRYAARLGLSAWSVWADWLEDVHVSCPECGTLFVPRPTQMRCSARCKNLASSREWKRRNADTNRQSRRAYYAAHGDYERARQRRYDALRGAA